MEKEKEDLSLKKKRDRDITHGITRNFQIDEYVAQVPIDLHSRAREAAKNCRNDEIVRCLFCGASISF